MTVAAIVTAMSKSKRTPSQQKRRSDKESLTTWVPPGFKVRYLRQADGDGITVSKLLEKHAREGLRNEEMNDD